MSQTDVKTRLLKAILPHVPFDGWSEAGFTAAVGDAGLEAGVARAVCPRGAIDLALAFHEAGDAVMLARLEQTDLGAMRYRDRVAAAVRYRLEAVGDKELVRRGMTLFALPQNAPEGARAVWQTCDVIWTALGDSSRDVNWYTKRATLAGVYSSTLLFWLGDVSEGHAASWEFLDRRIDNVMQIEKLKAGLRDNRTISGLMAGPLGLLSRIQAPDSGAERPRMPGRWSGPT